MKKGLILRFLAVVLLCCITLCAVSCNNDGGNGGSGSGQGTGDGSGVGGGSGDEEGSSTSGGPLKISILGDSISTYFGYVPQGNRSYYGEGGEHPEADIGSVDNTWWKKLAAYHGYEIEVNQSSSGSPVCNTGYHGSDATNVSYLRRMYNIGNPDVIVIFGGTNDWAAGVPIGNYKFNNWTADDLKTYRPAFAYMLDYLQTEHPDARIYVLVNTRIGDSVPLSTRMICQQYGVEYIDLPDYERNIDGIHPGIQGHNEIFEAINDTVV
jgi:lysophospholipase L1-like esterase